MDKLTVTTVRASSKVDTPFVRVYFLVFVTFQNLIQKFFAFDRFKILIYRFLLHLIKKKQELTG